MHSVWCFQKSHYVALWSVQSNSDARLFADDCLVYRQIRNQRDAAALQEVLAGRMGTQVADEFPPGKVHNNKILPLLTSYAFHGHQMKVVKRGMCLGDTIFQDLQWTNHIHTTIRKVTSRFSFLRRNLGQYTPSAKATAYCTLIRPAIKYASSEWDPHQATLTREVEQVQRRAARFIYNNYRDTSTGCVTILLHQLEWDSLQHRRTIQRLVLCYKIRNQLVDIDPEKYYTPGDIWTRGSHRLRQQRASKEVYRNSFFPRSVRDWNRVPKPVTAASTIEKLRTRPAIVPWTQLQAQ